MVILLCTSLYLYKHKGFLSLIIYSVQYKTNNKQSKDNLFFKLPLIPPPTPPLWQSKFVQIVSTFVILYLSYLYIYKEKYVFWKSGLILTMKKIGITQWQIK